MAEYKVVEIFTSINGEGIRAGQLAVFVRFQGCNLDCIYCDTRWANKEDAAYQIMTDEEIVHHILQTGVRNVTLTGGEPLLQNEIESLIQRLSEEDSLSVEIETNGSVELSTYDRMKNRPLMTMDYKLPASGMERYMCLDNFSHLCSADTVKFVCSGQEDLERASQIIKDYRLTERCHVIFSPAFGRIDPVQMVEFMKERKLNGVNLQLQLHKFIWSPTERGV